MKFRYSYKTKTVYVRETNFIHDTIDVEKTAFAFAFDKVISSE